MTRQKQFHQQYRLPLTYINIRKIVGILAMSLPLVVFLIDKVIFNRDLQTSISAYYYTEMRWYFILTLCCIGSFLFFYQGYEPQEKDGWLTKKFSDRRLAIIAGIAAFLTAIFPTEPTGLSKCISPLGIFNPDVSLSIGSQICKTTSTIHLASAATMFLTVAVFSWFRFTKGESNPSKEKRNRNVVYRICGSVIFLAILVMAAADLLPFDYTVYWGEFISLLAFGVTWAVKGEALWKDNIPPANSGVFNELQNRQYMGYKSGLPFFVFLVALWFTILLFAAETPPFNLFTEDKSEASSEEATPPTIQVLDAEALSPLCYPVIQEDENKKAEDKKAENEKQQIDTKCNFYNMDDNRVETEITIANSSADPVEISLDVLLKTPCKDQNQCVLINQKPVNPADSITEQIAGNGHEVFRVTFPAEELSGEIILIGGNALSRIPFSVMEETAWRAKLRNPAGETRTLGFYKTDAQNILTGIVFILVVVVFYFILNNQVLSLFWPLVRRNFRADLGTDSSEEKEILWTLFSNQVNELGIQPRFSINPRADTAIPVPSTLTPDSSYLKTFFDLMSWIFPRLGYSLRLGKVTSTSLDTGLSFAIVKNDRKESVSEKVFWAKSFGITEDKKADTGDDLEIQRLLMIPAYFWFEDIVDKMDGFDPAPHDWESTAYYHLGVYYWHTDLKKAINCYSNSIYLNKKNWPAYAALGRVWIEKSQEQSKKIAVESLLLANSYLNAAIDGLTGTRATGPAQGEPKEVLTNSKDVPIYFGALYNRIVALEYLANSGWNGINSDQLLLQGYKVKRAALLAFLDIQNAPDQGKQDAALAWYESQNTKWQNVKIECNSLQNRIKEKSAPSANHHTANWLILFFPTLEFVLQGFEARKNGFGDDGMDKWLIQIIKQFNTLPYFDPPVNMDKFIANAGNTPSRSSLRPHFTRSHYRIQYNAACFYSQVAALAPKHNREKFKDLALDHLAMALSAGGGLVEFAKIDSDLDVIRRLPRYRQIVISKPDKSKKKPGNAKASGGKPRLN